MRGSCSPRNQEGPHWPSSPDSSERFAKASCRAKLWDLLEVSRGGGSSSGKSDGTVQCSALTMALNLTNTQINNPTNFRAPTLVQSLKKAFYTLFFSLHSNSIG